MMDENVDMHQIFIAINNCWNISHKTKMSTS